MRPTLLSIFLAFAGLLVTLLVDSVRAASPIDDGRTHTTAEHTAVGQQDPKRVKKAARAWLNAYQRGKFDIAKGDFLGEDAISVKLGALPASRLGQLTYLSEIDYLCGALAEADDTESFELLLEVVAVGTEGVNYRVEHQPGRVRRIAEDALGKVESAACKEHGRKLASGEEDPSNRKIKVAVQAAAVRALGHFKEPAFRPTIESQLQHEEPLVRIGAARSLSKLSSVNSLEALAQALKTEADPRTLIELAEATHTILTPLTKDPDSIPREGLRAVEAAISAIGRGSWRSDMAIIDLLSAFRNKGTVPALIKVLERFVSDPDAVRSGELSGLLRHRAHDLLVSLTGAVYPMARPDQWRDFWTKEQGGFRLAKEAPQPKEGGTAGGGFFGIPVQGTRVTFVLDVSGSMEWPMPRGTTGADTRGASEARRRLDAAKSELLKAVDAMPEIASFNLVTFGDQVRTWQKDMVPANDKAKARFRKYVEGLRPMGGTNLYGGMQEGLEMKSLVWTDRYETHVDEIFLLSDGAPSVGDVIDPAQILQLVADANRIARVRINTVFISGPNARGGASPGGPGGGPGGGRGMAPSRFMETMAEQNGGNSVVIR